jgi:hypothetical protein
MELAVIYKAIAYLIGWIASIGAATWVAVKFIPQQWLQHKFNQQLEQLRAENAREQLEARHRLDVVLRQVAKLHEKEFDVLSDCWLKLNEALGHVSSLISSFQQYADLDRIEQKRFEAFVAGCRLEEVDKQDLLDQATGHRNEFYQGRLFWYRLRDAQTACNEELRRLRCW